MIIDGRLTLAHVGSHLAFGLTLHDKFADVSAIRVEPVEFFIESFEQGCVYSDGFQRRFIGNEGVTEGQTFGIVKRGIVADGVAAGTVWANATTAALYLLSDAVDFRSNGTIDIFRHRDELHIVEGFGVANGKKWGQRKSRSMGEIDVRLCGGIWCKQQQTTLNNMNLHKTP